MTRKHFQMLADHMVETAHLYKTRAAYWEAVTALVVKLREENERFDADKFFLACQV